jgi:hypothetical protein
METRMADWRHDALALAASYAHLHWNAENTEEEEHRGIGRRRLVVLKYLQNMAQRKERELREIVKRDWTEEKGRQFVAESQKKFEWRRLLFDQLFGDNPAVRRGYMHADDRDNALSTVEDPETREIVEILTSKTGVALKAAHAVAKLRSRAKRNASGYWEPGGPRAQRLIARYTNDPNFAPA